MYSTIIYTVQYTVQYSTEYNVQGKPENCGHGKQYWVFDAVTKANSFTINLLNLCFSFIGLLKLESTSRLHIPKFSGSHCIGNVWMFHQIKYYVLDASTTMNRIINILV